MIHEKPIWLVARLINASHGAVATTRTIIGGPKSGRVGSLGTDAREGKGELFYEDLSNRIIHRCRTVPHRKACD